MSYIKLSCDEIYSSIVRGKDPTTEQTIYLYYLVPFKEKVFFYPQRGLAEALDRGAVSEITLKPDSANPKRYLLMGWKTYPNYIENKLVYKCRMQMNRNRQKRY